MCMSDPQTPVARTLINTSPGSGSGFGTSLTSITPGLRYTTAFIVERSSFTLDPPFPDFPSVGFLWPHDGARAPGWQGSRGLFRLRGDGRGPLQELIDSDCLRPYIPCC